MPSEVGKPTDGQAGLGCGEEPSAHCRILNLAAIHDHKPCPHAEDHAAVRVRSIQHSREARGAVIPKVPYQKISLTLPL